MSHFVAPASVVSEAGITRLSDTGLVGIGAGVSSLNENPERFAAGGLEAFATSALLDDFEGELSLANESVLEPMVSLLLLAATDVSFFAALHGMASVGGFIHDADPKPIAGPEVQPV